MPPPKGKRLERGQLRMDEDGNPLLVVESQLKNYVHSHVDVTMDDGDVETVKMAATKPFLRAFNRKVFNLLEESLDSAFEDGRNRLTEQDVNFGDDQEEEPEP